LFFADRHQYGLSYSREIHLFFSCGRGKVPHTHQIVFYLFTTSQFPTYQLNTLAATSADLLQPLIEKAVKLLCSRQQHRQEAPKHLGEPLLHNV